MAETKKDPRRIVIGPVRLSYVFFAEPALDEEKETKSYRCMVLVPKSDTNTIDKIRRATAAAAIKKFGKETAKKALKSKKFHTPLRDPEEEGLEDEVYKDMVFFNCKAQEKRRPGYALKNRTRLTDPDEISEHLYSGCWAYVSLSFYYFKVTNQGIAVGLNNVLKDRDDDRLDGGTSVEQDFEDLFEDDEFSGKDSVSDSDDMLSDSDDDDWL